MGNPQERSLAWLAGIVDGEGTVSAQVVTSAKGVRILPFVCVINSDEGILSEVEQILTEIGVNHRRFGHNKAQHMSSFRGSKPCWTVRTNGQEHCSKLLTLILPYLKSVKAKYASVILEYSKIRKNTLLTRNQKNGRIVRNPYTKEQVMLICSIRTSKRAKSSEAICQAPNVVG